MLPGSGVFLLRRFSSDLKRNFHAPIANAEIWITGHEWEICKKIQVRAYSSLAIACQPKASPCRWGDGGGGATGSGVGCGPPREGTRRVLVRQTPNHPGSSVKQRPLGKPVHSGQSRDPGRAWVSPGHALGFVPPRFFIRSLGAVFITN